MLRFRERHTRYACPLHRTPLMQHGCNRLKTNGYTWYLCLKGLSGEESWKNKIHCKGSLEPESSLDLGNFMYNVILCIYLTACLPFPFSVYFCCFPSRCLIFNPCDGLHWRVGACLKKFQRCCLGQLILV